MYFLWLDPFKFVQIQNLLNLVTFPGIDNKLLKPANSGVAAPSPGFLIPKDGATLLIRAGRSKSLELAILCLAMYLGEHWLGVKCSYLDCFSISYLPKKRAVDTWWIDVILPRCIVRVLTY